MGVIWALRSDHSDKRARYAPGGKDAADFGTAAFAGLTTWDNDATAIGSKCINMDGGFGNVSRGLAYPGRNTFTNQAISILMRVQLPLRQTVGLFEISGGPSWNKDAIILYTVATGSGTDFRMNISNADRAYATNQGIIYGTDPDFNAWIDLLWTWTGTTASNGIKFWLNGSHVGSLTAAVAASNPRSHLFTDKICIGGVQNLLTARMKINEVVIWDSVIDPTSVALTSGTGALNGASRTAFVDVASLDGAANTDPGISNVRSGTDYVIAGVDKEGTMQTVTNVVAGARLSGPASKRGLVRRTNGMCFLKTQTFAKLHGGAFVFGYLSTGSACGHGFGINYCTVSALKRKIKAAPMATREPKEPKRGGDGKTRNEDSVPLR